MDTSVVLKDVRVHQNTGYIEVDLMTVAQDGNSKMEGFTKTYGADIHHILHGYNGDTELWLQAIKGEHARHSNHHAEVTADLHRRKGKEI